MIGLGIEFRCEPLNVLTRDQLVCSLEAHAESEIIKPLDHDPAPLSYLTKFILPGVPDITPPLARSLQRGQAFLVQCCGVPIRTGTLAVSFL
jgi:hypothetical protein